MSKGSRNRSSSKKYWNAPYWKKRNQDDKIDAELLEFFGDIKETKNMKKKDNISCMIMDGRIQYDKTTNSWYTKIAELQKECDMVQKFDDARQAQSRIAKGK